MFKWLQPVGQVTKQPTKVTFKGVEPGSEQARVLLDEHRAQISHFQRSQAQNFQLGSVNAMKVRRQYPGMTMTYTNRGGNERIDIEVTGAIVKGEQEQVIEGIWDTALVELVVPGYMTLGGIVTCLATSAAVTVLDRGGDPPLYALAQAGHLAFPDPNEIGLLEKVLYDDNGRASLRVDLRGSPRILSVQLHAAIPKTAVQVDSTDPYSIIGYGALSFRVSKNFLAQVRVSSFDNGGVQLVADGPWYNPNPNTLLPGATWIPGTGYDTDFTRDQYDHVTSFLRHLLVADFVSGPVTDQYYDYFEDVRIRTYSPLPIYAPAEQSRTCELRVTFFKGEPDWISTHVGDDVPDYYEWNLASRTGPRLLGSVFATVVVTSETADLGPENMARIGTVTLDRKLAAASFKPA